MTPDLIQIAHDALCRNPAPFLHHYKRGRFAERHGAFYSGNELPGPGFNFASCVGPTGTLAEVVEFGREFFVDATDGWGVLVEGGAGHPVEAEMLAAGWKIAEDEPAFVMPVITPPTIPTLAGLSIRPIRTEADRQQFVAVCAAGYGAPPDMTDAIMPSLAFATDAQMRSLIADLDGKPVGVGGCYIVGPTAVIGCLATPDEHRGRGIGANLVRYLLMEATTAGCRHACLRSGPKSVPLYERLGFRYACQHRTYSVP